MKVARRDQRLKREIAQHSEGPLLGPYDGVALRPIDHA
jgi:hypothetical protein